MRRRMLITGLVLSLSGSPAFGQSLQNSIRQSALALGAQQTQIQKGGRIPPAFLLPSVGLLVAGGIVFMTGTMGCGKEFQGGGCKNARMAKGAAIAGAGGVLLWVGKVKSKASPQLLITPDGIVLRSRLTF